MFCEKCGKENPNGASFCDACGNPLNAAPQAPAGNFTAPQGNFAAPQAPQQFGGMTPMNFKFDWKKILMIAIPAFVALVLIISLVACLGSCGAEGALKAYFDGVMYGKNPKAYMEVMMDPVKMEYYIDEGEYDDKADILDYYTDICDENKDYYEELKDDYDKVSFKYEIKKTYKYDKDEIEAVGEYYEKNFSADYDEKDIEDVVTFKVKATKVLDDDKDTDTSELTFVKIKGKWCFMGYYDHKFIKDLD